jgi:hypothetical protein
MVATRKLAARLCSISILYPSEASLSNKDGANNISDNPDNGLAHHHATMMVEGIMLFLTRTEGNMLSQMLLLPWDCGGGGVHWSVIAGGSHSRVECHQWSLQC